MGFRRCWGLTAAIPVVAGVVTGEDHRSCCLPLPRGSASFRSPLPPELPRTTAVAAAGIVNGRRRCCFRYSHSRRRSQPRRRTELPENATAATELHWRSPLLLGADCRAAAEPVRRPPLFRFSRSFESLWLLRKRFGAEVLVVGILIVDFGSRQKGRCDAFELWNLRFENALEIQPGSL
ncbi:uncharacterized protein DS421_17g581810 [Arachis hypogaea]|nr:uncharacterized protein DS421_17g581810 [Arachis hypogaea]